jgi:peptide chain release factor
VLLMHWLQLSANTGPAECGLAVAKALARLLREAASAGVPVSIIEQVDGEVNGTIASVLLELDDATFARRWTGSLLWTCPSPYRSGHKRKNWFISGTLFAQPAPADALDPGTIRYEATRASGPGGQHVNKTDSAIRATHIASGLSVKVQTGRSQHANKRLAGQLLASKLAALVQARTDADRSARHAGHRQAERGNAARVFVGMDFREGGFRES